MATVVRSFSTIIDLDTFNEIPPLIENYWGTLDEEKVFPIAAWRLNQLISVSSSEEVAFRVKNIFNRSLMDGEWIVFEEGMEELLENVRPDEYYFILNERQFNAIISEIDTLETPISTIVFWGRIGKLTADGFDFTAFLVPTAGVTSAPGSGGGGASGGLRLPPAGGDDD